MKLLFLENRYKTFFWDKIAERLIEMGFEVYWIIQNKSFVPKNGYKVFIDYPSKKTINIVNNTQKNDYEFFANIKKSDRAINYFDLKNCDHYLYYLNKINEVLTSVKPDIVFGEATLFHELITLYLCKSMGILYLSPQTCRYPTGRFSFYKYDSYEVYGNSGDSIDHKNAEYMINKIISREIIPDYMKKLSNKNKLKSVFYSKLIISYSYLRGEKFNTPSPLTKLRLELRKRNFQKEWDRIACKRDYCLKDQTYFKILYPLQLQPEANIDVYCSKYRNQTQVLECLLQNTSNEDYIFIKPNPKFKYEVNRDMLNLIEKNERLIPIDSKTSMDDIIEKMNLIITGTGTISFEASFSNIPNLTLTTFIPNRNKNCKLLKNFASLPKIIKSIRDGIYPKLNLEEKVEFLEYLYDISFKGVIADPYSLPSCILKENIDNVLNGFIRIINLTRDNDVNKNR